MASAPVSFSLLKTASVPRPLPTTSATPTPNRDSFIQGNSPASGNSFNGRLLMLPAPAPTAAPPGAAEPAPIPQVVYSTDEKGHHSHRDLHL